MIRNLLLSSQYPLKLNGDPDTISLKSLKLNGTELSPLESIVGVSRRDTGYFWDTREKILSLGCCPIDEEFVVEAEVVKRDALLACICTHAYA